jgi:hypothetical protein
MLVHRVPDERWAGRAMLTVPVAVVTRDVPSVNWNFTGIVLPALN